MKRIYISSLNRVHDPNEEGDLGKLYLLDWDTKKVIPHSVESEAIQIGRSRGIRGIAFNQDRNWLWVAGVNNKLSVYDANTMNLLDTFDVSEAKFLHQIRVHDQTLHLVSTGNDRIFRGCGDYENIGKIFHLIDPHITDPSFPDWGNDRLHFNSIAWDENGDEYHVYNSPRMIFNWSKREVFMQGGPFHSLHDIVINPKEIIVNSSGDRTTLAIDRKTKEITVIHKNRSRPSEEHNLHGMTRGLAQFDDYLFVGVTPGTILCFRLKRGEWEYDSHVVLSEDRRESIFDILLDPRDWK
jgi:WD40 repeat protein